MKKTLLILVTILLLFSIVGCGPTGDPEQIVNDYYQSIIDGNFEAAYAYLSADKTKDLSMEEFITYQELMRQVYQFKDFKITEVEDSNKELDGVTYENIKAYDCVQTVYSYFDDREFNNTVRVYMVGDDGEWGCYSAITDREIAMVYEYVGGMYADGEGVAQDRNLAITYFKNGLLQDPSYYQLHYSLGRVYYLVGRDDDALEELNILIDMSDDDIEKSDALNIVGLIYVYADDMTNAKKTFEQALQLNPDNEYAQYNMALYFD